MMDIFIPNATPCIVCTGPLLGQYHTAWIWYNSGSGIIVHALPFNAGQGVFYYYSYGDLMIYFRLEPETAAFIPDEYFL